MELTYSNKKYNFYSISNKKKDSLNLLILKSQDFIKNPQGAFLVFRDGTYCTLTPARLALGECEVHPTTGRPPQAEPAGRINHGPAQWSE